MARRKHAPKGSIPVVCYHENTKSFIAMDEGHPLLEESYIHLIGSRADFDMNGKPLKEGVVPATKFRTSEAPVVEAPPEPEVEAVLDVEAELEGVTIVTADAPEAPEEVVEEEEVPRELGYTELKDELDKLGIEYKGNASKAALAELYLEATADEE